MKEVQAKLAIVIPAYKTDFIEDVFRAITNQTNTSFILYVFDDASPYEIKFIFDKYFANCSFARYHRFEENLGGKDLVGQWNRCIANTTDEEWIWMFSDDDVMEPSCVADFFNNFESISAHDVVRFHWDMIDSDGKIIKRNSKYPEIIDSLTFFESLLCGKLDARLPEFIFRRSKLEEIGGFVNFDLGWRSDNASVIATAFPRGIFSINSSKVFWRQGRTNITCLDDVKIVKRKITSTLEYCNWIKAFFEDKKTKLNCNKSELIKFAAKNITTPSSHCIAGLFELSKKIKLVESLFDSIYFVFYRLLFDVLAYKGLVRIKRIIYILTH